MSNILNTLDTILGYDDETNKVNRKDIQVLRNQLEKDVNCFGFKPERVYTEFRESVDESGRGKDLIDPTVAYRYAEGRLFRWALQWIWFWGTTTDKTNPNSKAEYFKTWVDPRNEAAVRICQELCQNENFLKLLTDYTIKTDFSKRFTDDINEAFYTALMVEVNGSMHRTNVQTATQLMLYAVANFGDATARKLKKDLEEERGAKFYGLPLV